ncbi:MAG: hypothetical protein FWD78_16665 [Treponema sp.]|nr:hypothetical protein [Treponema sp.]
MNMVKRFVIIVFFGFIGIGIISAQSYGEILMLNSMAIYEDYGLKYNVENKFYYFNNKTVRYFVDDQIGIMHLNPTGEIYIKVNRDNSGKIINIVELTPEEYIIVVDILSEMDMKNVILNARRIELMETRERLLQNRNQMIPVPNFY